MAFPINQQDITLHRCQTETSFAVATCGPVMSVFRGRSDSLVRKLGPFAGSAVVQQDIEVEDGGE